MAWKMLRFLGKLTHKKDLLLRPYLAAITILFCLPVVLLAETPADRHPLGPSSRLTSLVISEIMYHPAPNADGKDLEFVELHNTDPVALPIGGFRLTGEIEFTFPPGSMIAPGGFVVVAAQPVDLLGEVPGLSPLFGPWQGSLDNQGGTLTLMHRHEWRLLEVAYDDRDPWPVVADGTGHSLSLNRPSYGERDARAWGPSLNVGGSPGGFEPVASPADDAIVINELYRSSANPADSFVELYNRGGVPINLSGARITTNAAVTGYTVPANTTLPPGGHRAFFEPQLGFALDAARLMVFRADGQRALDALRVGPRSSNTAWGLRPDGDRASGMETLATETPAAQNARLDAAPVVINELMYNPLSNDDRDEYIELHNRGASAVDLSNWTFNDGIEFTFPDGTSLAAGAFLVVAKDAVRLRATYSALNAANTFGDFDGTLANRGERIALRRADGVLADVVEYRDAGRWGKWADGGGSSLELIDPDSDNRRPSNWADSDETQDAPWETFELTDTIRHAVNDAEELHICSFAGGEYQFDDWEVIGPGGNNMLSGWNANFEGTKPASGHWLFIGNHVRTTVEPGAGAGGSAGMHVRATRAGNFFANRCEVDLAPVYTNGVQLTFRVKARWVRGHDAFMVRLLGSGMEMVLDLPTPPEPGTPGQPNTQAAGNTAPAIWDTIHHPVVPQAAEDVLVTARADDPDGLQGLELVWHVDGSANETSVAMFDTGTGGDEVAGDGVFSARISGQSSGTLVGFRIEATDVNGLVSVFPDDAPLHEGLIRWGEAPIGGSFQSFRTWLRQSDIDVWQTYDELENEPVPMTFVIDDTRVIYGAEIRYRGNIGSRHTLFADGPTGPSSGSYAPMFPNDERVFNTDRLNMNLIGQTWEDETLMREKVSFWYFEQMGMPTQPSRYVHYLVNGQKGGPLYYEMCQLGDKEWRWGFYPGREEGDLHKALAYREVRDDFNIIRNTHNGTSVIPARLFAFRNPDGSLRKARYRWIWPRKGTDGKVNDDWSNFFDLVEAFDTSGDLETWRQSMEQTVNMRQWLLAHAVRHAVGGVDTISYGGAHNNHIYLPPGEKWELLERDIDTAFGRSAGLVSRYPANEDIFHVRDYPDYDVLLEKTFSTPAFRRLYMDDLRRSYESPGDPLHPTTFGAHVDAWRNVLLADGFAPDRFDVMETWVDARRSTVLNSIPAASFAITDVSYSTAANLGVIRGTAPVQADTILLNDSPYPIVWTSDTEWRAEVPLATGANAFEATALDVHGTSLAGATDTITITKTGPAPNPADHLVINEIDYHSVAADADFIELHNTSAADTFDISGWQVAGANLSVPDGTLIGPGSFLVFAEDRAMFRVAHGMLPVGGEYEGKLNNSGESLQLLDPSSNLVDAVVYGDRWPWPAVADGGGASLQRIDPSRRADTPANWEADVPVGFTPAAANSNTRPLPPIPRLSINEVHPVASWVEMYSSSLVTQTGINLTDDPSQLEKYPFPSLILRGARQTTLPGLDPATGVVAVTWSPPGETLVLHAIEYDRVGANHSIGLFPDGAETTKMLFHKPTPNQPNDPTSIPAPVVFNEWLAINDNGDVDPADGDREDWLELYNQSDTPSDLSWYFLSNDPAEPRKYRVPAGTILDPSGHVFFWADDEADQGPTHLDFKLSGSGETLILSAPDGTMVDSFTFDQQTADVAEGRWKDGAPAPFWPLELATPGAANVYVVNNTPPIVTPSDQTAMYGMPLRYAVPGFDPEAIPQRIGFQLVAGPGQIDAVTGLYTWTPQLADAGGTATVTVLAMDNAPIPLANVSAFTVRVAPKMVLDPFALSRSGEIRWPTLSGLTYHVEYCNDLPGGVWNPLQSVTASGDLTAIADPGADSQKRRAYRIKAVP